MFCFRIIKCWRYSDVRKPLRFWSKYSEEKEHDMKIKDCVRKRIKVLRKQSYILRS